MSALAMPASYIPSSPSIPITEPPPPGRIPPSHNRESPSSHVRLLFHSTHTHLEALAIQIPRMSVNAVFTRSKPVLLKTEYPSSNSTPSQHRAHLDTPQPRHSNARGHPGAAAGTAGIPSAGPAGSPSGDPGVVAGIPSAGAGRSGSSPAAPGRRTGAAETRIGVVVSRSRLGCCRRRGRG